MALTSVQSFHSPEDSQSVVALLEKYEDSALIVAGGTFLHGLVSRGLLSGIEALISIQKLGLNEINIAADEIELGATTLLGQLKNCQQVKEDAWLGAIRDAMEYPPVQIMNAGTIGGSISSSCPFFDFPVALLSLGGTVTATGSKGERSIPVNEFFAGLFENSLTSDEFVTAVRIPVPEGRSTSAFIKMETNANDLAILNIAVSLSIDDENKCVKANVIVGGGVGEIPHACPSAEKILSGAALNEESFAKAGDAVLADVDPLDDHRASADYRKAMTRVLLQRALHRAAERLA